MTKRAVFLDRDGTLIEHYDVLTASNQVQLIPAVPVALKLLRDRGFLLVMVTNQSAVAKGLLKEKKLLEIHDTLRSLLAANGVYLDAIYYCPYHPNAKIEKYRKDSPLRKPKPGMIHQAARDLDIDLTQSWVVGDDDRDVEMGRTAGCRTVFIESYGSVGVRQGNSNPHFRAVNLQEAANLIVRNADPSDESAPEPEPSDQNENRPSSNSTSTGESELAQLHHVPIDLPTPDQPQPMSSPGATQVSNAAVSPPVTQTKTTEPQPVSLRGANEVSDAAISPPGTQKKTTEPQSVLLRETNEVSDAAISSPVTQSKTFEDSTHSRPVRIPPHPDSTPSDRKLPPLDTADYPKEESHDLLAQILRELKAQNRSESFRDFSIAKLLAGITQMVVVFFVVLAFSFHNAQNPSPDSVQSTLLAAAVFQLVTLSLLVLHKH